MQPAVPSPLTNPRRLSGTAPPGSASRGTGHRTGVACRVVSSRAARNRRAASVCRFNPGRPAATSGSHRPRRTHPAAAVDAPVARHSPSTSSCSAARASAARPIAATSSIAAAAASRSAAIRSVRTSSAATSGAIAAVGGPAAGAGRAAVDANPAARGGAVP